MTWLEHGSKRYLQEEDVQLDIPDLTILIIDTLYHSYSSNIRSNSTAESVNLSWVAREV